MLLLFDVYTEMSTKSRVPSHFALEQFSAKYEFVTPHLLCCSDAETWKVKDLVAQADDECKALWDDMTLSYTQFKGHPLLVKEIAAFHGVDESEVNVAAPQECIYIGMHCIVEHLRRWVLI